MTTKKKDYLETVTVAVQAVIDNAPIMTLLTERCGYTPEEFPPMLAMVEPAKAAARRMSDAAQGLDQASTELKSSLKDIQKNLTGLRRTMNDNLKPRDPLFKKLGLNEKQPQAQEPLLIYAEHVFSQGQDLGEDEGAMLTRRKWDAARFTAALAQVTTARAANLQQEGCKGESVAATAAFYDAIDAIDASFRPFAKNARSKLADVPGVLETLELKGRIPTKPQRPVPSAARKKPAVKTAVVKPA